MMTDAVDKDVGNLDGPKGCQNDNVRPPECLPHELAAFQPNHLWDLPAIPRRTLTDAHLTGVAG